MGATNRLQSFGDTFEEWLFHNPQMRHLDGLPLRFRIDARQPFAGGRILDHAYPIPDLLPRVERIAKNAVTALAAAVNRRRVPAGASRWRNALRVERGRDCARRCADGGDTPRTDVGAELDEALSSEVIEIELQSVLQASSVTRSRRCCTRRS